VKLCGFPSQFQKCLEVPVEWKTITFDTNLPMLQVEFDSLEFPARLVAAKIRQSHKVNSTLFTYTLQFEKPIDLEVDNLLRTYLKQKDADEFGRLAFIHYPLSLSRLADGQPRF